MPEEDMMPRSANHPTRIVLSVAVSGWRKGYRWESLTVMRVLSHVGSRALKKRGMDYWNAVSSATLP